MSTLETRTIPVVELGAGDRHQTRAAIAAACQESGFFYITGHPIPEEVTSGLLASMRSFFGSDASFKLGVSRSEREPWGYYDRELTKNRRDAKEIFDCGSPNDDRYRTPWPPGHSSLRDYATAYASAAERTARELVGMIAEALGTNPASVMGTLPPRNGSFLRLNFYPPTPTGTKVDASPNSTKPFGVHEHTDAGALTVLLQDDEAGLEAFLAGGWHLVQPRPRALLVNIGDMIQVWSNDRYRAALHRVRAAGARARYSAPFFLNPAYEAKCEPLPSTVSAAKPARYRPIAWGEFRELRASGDYHDVGREVQIDDYRIVEPPLPAGSQPAEAGGQPPGTHSRDAR